MTDNMTNDKSATSSRAQLSNAEIKRLKGIGHDLKPVVMVGGNGLTEGVVSEIERALTDHELIKIKTPAGSKAEREAMGHAIAEQTGAVMIQHIGRMALLFKPNPNANPKLSNLIEG